MAESNFHKVCNCLEQCGPYEDLDKNSRNELVGKQKNEYNKRRLIWDVFYLF